MVEVLFTLSYRGVRPRYPRPSLRGLTHTITSLIQTRLRKNRGHVSGCLVLSPFHHLPSTPVTLRYS